ncbi:hypothetical protein GCM10010218_65760 [Streptomyces mashuensis]|uniref:Transposase n=1 Tax=Streptomyces mashuensis TaxID=33904 RepID=A0A919EGZ2_9ACTN|nr:hypothetical protein GCM10010218_65760 [Streptomyces mashuensis]
MGPMPPRYERNPRHYLAFLGLAAAICCSKRLVRLATWDTVQAPAPHFGQRPGRAATIAS